MGKKTIEENNMFVEAAKYRPADSVDECLKTDPVSDNLWLWAQRLERWGKTLMILLLVWGIYEIISNVVQTAEYISFLEDKHGVDWERACAVLGCEIPSLFDVAVDGILQWGFICFIEYCAYHALALFIGALASITHDSKVTARLAEYTAKHGAELKRRAEEDEDKLPEL